MKIPAPKTLHAVLMAVLFLACLLMPIPDILGMRKTVRLDPALFTHEKGHCYKAPFPRGTDLLWHFSPDVPGSHYQSRLTLLEDGELLGPAHTPHNRIVVEGFGRYSNWQDVVYFSGSDNQDPRTSGRTYRVSYPMLFPWRIEVGVFLVFLLLWASRGRMTGPGRDGVLPVRPGRRARTVAWGGFLALIVMGCLWGLPHANGPWFTTLLGLLAAAFLGLYRMALPPESKGARKALSGKVLPLVLASCLALACAGIWLKYSGPESIREMPEKWKRRDVTLLGVDKAYYYHGKLHAFDINRMRRMTPVPEKRDNVFRIMVVGDSYTYGMGVSGQETYPMLLESRLQKDFQVEVINAGIMGSESKEIADVIRKFLPQYKPDLIVYGANPNDFQDSRKNRLYRKKAYSIPIPLGIKELFINKTRIGALVARAYDRALMRAGLRLDFYGSILAGFEGFQERFAKDVMDMNRTATRAGLPPVVAMVLNHVPGSDDRDKMVAHTAEDLMKKAGMEVIPSAAYFERYYGRRFVVSAWDHHPNARGHRIFAEEFLLHLQKHPALMAYKKPVPVPP